jgi:hypothetical protein
VIESREMKKPTWMEVGENVIKTWNHYTMINLTSKIKEAYNWAKSFKLSSIKDIAIDLKGRTIRQLKAIAAKMNQELGLVICKAMFGKSLSNMCKDELIAAIWIVRQTQMSRPVGHSDWNLTKIGDYCFQMNHVTYFGFNDTERGTAEQNAFSFHSYILKNGLCKLASMRKADRLKDEGFAYEVKVWGINPDLLKNFTKVVKKSSSASQPGQVGIAGQRFIVQRDDVGWIGESGVIAKVIGDDVLCLMDVSVQRGEKSLVRFKKYNLLIEDATNSDIEMRIFRLQQMYNVAKKTKKDISIASMAEFISSQGFELVNERVELAF